MDEFVQSLEKFQRDADNGPLTNRNYPRRPYTLNSKTE